MKDIKIKFYVECDGERVTEDVEVDCQLYPEGLSQMGALAVQSTITSYLKRFARQEFQAVR